MTTNAAAQPICLSPVNVGADDERYLRSLLALLEQHRLTSAIFAEVRTLLGCGRRTDSAFVPPQGDVRRFMVNRIVAQTRSSF